MTERFALYLVPARDHALTRAAAAWLGRDAWSGDSVPPPDHPAVAALPDLADATAFPRGYGFHATLKAPFTLAADTDEAALAQAAAGFAAARRPLPPLRLEPAVLGSFVALRPVAPDPALQDLADAVVRTFEPFRAPLTPAEQDRRLSAGLTPRQRDHVLRWGYPYVFEDFACHLTLTGPLAQDGLRQRFRDAFAAYAGAALAEPVALSRLALFHQPAAGSPFVIRAAWVIGGDAAAGRAADQSSGRSGS